MMPSFYQGIDDFLGKRESRYFGEGYLRSDQSIRDFRIHHNESGLHFSCLGSVCLPELWSQKGDSQQTPHLSTIDVIELSVASLRRLFQSTLHGVVVPATSIKRIKITAGNSPVESDLDSIGITGHVRSDHGGEYVVDIQIVNMTLEIAFSHGLGPHAPALSSEKQPVKVHNVMALAHEEQAVAFAMVKSEHSDVNQSWSLSSCFAAALQLGQTLLYELDGVSRAESNTLWMKRNRSINPVLADGFFQEAEAEAGEQFHGSSAS
ncbi:avrd-related protein [Pseudomonas aeruginosa]|nr:avrd-related protein [Pseudomonas aeruginosa]